MLGIKQKIETKKLERDKFIASLNLKSFDFQISTWFGSGLIVPAPGTWGSIGGAIIGIPLFYLTNPLIVFLVAIALFFIGLNSVGRIEKKLEHHDPSFIVIDEVVAVFLLISLGCSQEIFFFAFPILFILFRIFDAWKPWPIRWADRSIKGAWGVMIDDILAAIAALGVFYLILFIFTIISMVS